MFASLIPFTPGTKIWSIWIRCHEDKTGCWLSTSQKIGSLIPSSSGPHADVSLGYILNPKLLLMAALQFMNVCEWLVSVWWAGMVQHINARCECTPSALHRNATISARPQLEVVRLTLWSDLSRSKCDQYSTTNIVTKTKIRRICWKVT